MLILSAILEQLLYSRCCGRHPSVILTVTCELENIMLILQMRKLKRRDVGGLPESDKQHKNLNPDVSNAKVSHTYCCTY